MRKCIPLALSAFLGLMCESVDVREFSLRAPPWTMDERFPVGSSSGAVAEAFGSGCLER